MPKIRKNCPVYEVRSNAGRQALANRSIRYIRKGLAVDKTKKRRRTDPEFRAVIGISWTRRSRIPSGVPSP